MSTANDWLHQQALDIGADRKATKGEQAKPQSAVHSPSQADNPAGKLEFVTFDPGRKHLARIVAVNGKKVTVRRFNKKTGEWQPKNESRECKACIPLTATEAAESFPGSVAVWAMAAKRPNVHGGKVTRQISRNLAAPLVAAPTFKSVADFVSAYSDKKKVIDDLTDKFVDKVGEAKQAQDDIIPHLAFMQSLLSKRGTHHHLVIAARKRGHKIPWWTEYYETYRDRLWESLRTMERRIAAYRNDPTEREPKPDHNPIPQLTKADRKRLVEASHRANALIAALEAGRDGKTEMANYKAVMDARRLDDLVQVQERESEYFDLLDYPDPPVGASLKAWNDWAWGWHGSRPNRYRHF
ncbi:MAG TPA: hypothetical protein VFN26_21485 [Candidatus Acidoferrum sp.]|nr:hypothetical protein [Candidatus Acidoferrum sp.]